MPEKTQTYEHVKRPKVSRVDRFKRMQMKALKLTSCKIC